jgi:type IV secretory pathway VirB3-like protein
MASISRILPNERGRFFLLAFLFFVNAMILESNEVVATSGFISNVGVPQILVVWAIDMTIIILTSGVYSLFVDRTKRGRLAVILYFLFFLVYLGLYGLFNTSEGMVGYGILLVINDQQWLLFPLVIWALANDMFQISEAKRLFPILGIAAFTGGIAGNAIAASVAQISGASYRLLLFSAVLILISGIILMLSLNRMKVTNRPAGDREGILDSLREGLGFVREVPIFRYLTLAMILLGIGLNAIEFDFLSNVSQQFTSGEDIQTFYGVFKIAVAIALLILQLFVASRLLNRIGFKNIFTVFPTAMIAGLTLAFFFPSILGVVVGNYIVRVTKVGIDEPSIKAFQGLVPDERRGRVSAFMDGYLYPLGSILSCILVGSTMIAVANNTLTQQSARSIYLGVAIFAAVIALISASRINSQYDKSMLNWRLKRRRRTSTVTDKAFAGASSVNIPVVTTKPRRSTPLLDSLIEDSESSFDRVAIASATAERKPQTEFTTDGLDDLLSDLPLKRRKLPDFSSPTVIDEASKDSTDDQAQPSEPN